MFNSRPPLPDTGQWLLLALNEKLPEAVLLVLDRCTIHVYHGSWPSFTCNNFCIYILPSARPWCVKSRYSIIPRHPHHWAQKYYTPYASDSDAIRQVIKRDMAYVDSGNYGVDYCPDWGSMSFLRFSATPTSEGSSWYSLLKLAGGGCNDLVYSGHMLVAVLTAMAWTEAYGGFSSALIWCFSAQCSARNTRATPLFRRLCCCHLCGILLWKMTGFIWSAKGGTRDSRLTKLGKIQGRLLQAKDSDMDEVRELLKDLSWGIKKARNMDQARLCGCLLVGPFSSPLPLLFWPSHGQAMADFPGITLYHGFEVRDDSSMYDLFPALTEGLCSCILSGFFSTTTGEKGFVFDTV
ncbi:Detected protein of confused Function [Hibiscus syriacus]|uniref:Detected protein of confused Function n=1 Tax=Hibiscus syriacus TaxID=106335 RepID=A0A6A2ZF97_HIBSY|nr:Detected protein of confused Function [Hibiscus syriacus]